MKNASGFVAPVANRGWLTILKSLISCRAPNHINRFGVGKLNQNTVCLLNVEMLFDVLRNNFTVEQVDDTVRIVSIVR